MVKGTRPAKGYVTEDKDFFFFSCPLDLFSERLGLSLSEFKVFSSTGLSSVESLQVGHGCGTSLTSGSPVVSWSSRARGHCSVRGGGGGLGGGLRSR